MAKRKREEATVSFHYLIREKRAEGVAPEIVPFTDEQFKAFCAKLIAQPDIDLNDDATCKYLKTTINAPVEKCEQVDDRTVFGRFRSLYSGHAYDNTDVGEIPDSSVSLRPFFFLVYLSESGRITSGANTLVSSVATVAYREHYGKCCPMALFRTHSGTMLRRIAGQGQRKFV